MPKKKKKKKVYNITIFQPSGVLEFTGISGPYIDHNVLSFDDVDGEIVTSLPFLLTEILEPGPEEP